MTVKELKELLEDAEDDCKVVIFNLEKDDDIGIIDIDNHCKTVTIFTD